MQVGRSLCRMGCKFAVTTAVLHCGLLAAGLPTNAVAAEVGITAPEGFDVTLFADNSLANDIFSMTIDSYGRVVVSGPGYIRILHDEDGDGRAERASQFSDLPRNGAKGMVFVGDDLICTGDNSVMKLSDDDGDGKVDGNPEFWAKLRNPEHGANGLIQGPDGWVYLICGNDAGVSAPFATERRTPVRNPQSGAVLRFSPDGKRREIVAHGFRNVYDLAFNEKGHLFTVDSDGERDQHLPWYSPTRLFDIGQGMHHGWVLKGWQRSWNRPAWFPDVTPRLAELGRGSPTGVVVYRHRQFPARYQGSVMSCCWTLGRVYHMPLATAASSYETKPETFLQTTGEVGFAPVDLAVGPRGDLFVAIGGRGTRGSVFRVSYRGRDAIRRQGSGPLGELLLADQPLSAWSRAEWTPLARWFGASAFHDVLNDDLRTTTEKVRAVEILTELFDGVKSPLAEAVAAQGEQLAARVAWSLGRRPQGTRGAELLADLTYHDSHHVQRAAWESLATLAHPTSHTLDADWGDLRRGSDRRLRMAALLADASSRKMPGRGLDSLTELWRKYLRDGLEPADFGIAADVFLSSNVPGEQLECVRLMQLALGDVLAQSSQPDVFAGYQLNADPDETRAACETYGQALADVFPTEQVHVDRELARLLAMLAVDDSNLVSRVAAHIDRENVSAVDMVRYLMVLARLPGKRHDPARKAVASGLLNLPSQLAREQRRPSRNWPLRVGETFDALGRHDPELSAAMVSSPLFGDARQAIYVLRMPREIQDQAARQLVASVSALEDDEAWTEDMVRVVALLPDDEMVQVARELWGDFRLRDMAVELIVRRPDEQDRSRFVESLASVQPGTVIASAGALLELSPDGGPHEVASAIRALRQACADPAQRDTRESLVRLLRHWTNFDMNVSEENVGDLQLAYEPCFTWFRMKYPDQAARLLATGSLDADSWRDRLESIDWQAGDIAAGKQAFEKLSCVRCHAGNGRLGPDLAGAASRFSRDDLFAAIIDPNKNVSPLYHTTQIVTSAGKVYHGTIVYASPDGTLIQTAPDRTVRITGDEIISTKKSARSLMPVGLLNEATDVELADLYAYLLSLRKAE